MTNLATANKNWFLHIGGQPQGPFTLEQVGAKYREGVISRDTHVWCEGMAAWATCKDIPEVAMALTGTPSGKSSPSISSPPPRAPSSAQELSHLIDLNPKEVDDRTNAIDPSLLKAAKKQAAAALKVADKAEKKAYANGNSVMGVGSSGGGFKKLLVMVFIVLPLLAGAGAGGAVALKLITVDQLKAEVGKVLSLVTSTIPAMDDVTAPQFDALRTAAGADLATDGSKAAIAISSLTPDKPVFYVATNLPEGTKLSFSLKGDPTAVLSDQPVELRFPLTVSKHLAKSRPLHTVEGLAFPQGEYVATVVADDEQTADVKALLAKSKLVASQRFFLGGANDAAYTAKLGQLHQKQHDKGLTEYKQGVLIVTKLEAQLAMVNDAAQQLSKTSGKALQKLWGDFDRKWAASNSEPLEKGVYFTDAFAAIHEIWADGKKMHDLQQSVVSGSGNAATVWPQVTALSAQTAQKVTAVKTRLDAISRSVGAAQVAPAGH